MTSRERVFTALNHQEPDRVPIDPGGFQTGIHREAYRDRVFWGGGVDAAFEFGRIG